MINTRLQLAGGVVARVEEGHLESEHLLNDALRQVAAHVNPHPLAEIVLCKGDNCGKQLLAQQHDGDNGHDLALDLLLHFIKLFFKFHKNKEYSTLFENIRKIFDNSKNYYSPDNFQRDKEKSPKKYNTYKEFNEEFCSKFKKEKKYEEKFKVGDKVDFLLYNEAHYPLEKKIWIRGEIAEIDDENYTIHYPKNSLTKVIKIPLDAQRVKELGSMTPDWDWRLNLKKFDLVDCYDRCKWYPATVCEVTDYENKCGVYKEYRIGFRLYPDRFIENSEYNYDTFVSCMVFWDNNNNTTDKEGNSYYGDFEQCDEKLAFYSKRGFE